MPVNRFIPIDAAQFGATAFDANEALCLTAIFKG
jgi:hypothetical protein